MFLENSLNSQDVTLVLCEHKLCVRRGDIFSATVLLFVYTINMMAQVSEKNHKLALTQLELIQRHYSKICGAKRI